MARRQGIVAAFALSLGVVGATAPLAHSAEVEHSTAVRDRAVGWTPHLAPSGDIGHPAALAVGQVGDTVVVGGNFDVVENADRSTQYDRRKVFAFTTGTGEVLDFDPDLVHADGTRGRVKVMAVTGGDDGSIYIGGNFRWVDGVVRPRVAKLDPVTGELDRSFRTPIRGGRVTDLKLVGGVLYAAGTYPDKLLALDPQTGEDTGLIDIEVTGTVPNSLGRTDVNRIDVTNDGTHLMGVGNFTHVEGASRSRAFMLDLAPGGATLSDWYYASLEKRCLSSTRARQPYLRDVDFAPDGSYFVLGATGYVPYRTSEIGETICDATARFETDILHPARPTWINYTGGDTVQSVVATGAAVYTQGHFRWLDNPYGKDSAGPGAVDRRGIGAIDPVTGRALDWQVFKAARRGGKDFLATDEGLWVASDSRRFGRYHRGIAFAPLP